jgi:hydroxymethylglutaryl-CoA lyase
MAMPSRVRIVEVGPRDGLQNEPKTVPAEVKIGLVERLAEAGLRVIETGSFVSPKWVPQMADSDRVFAGIARRPGVTYAALVPNRRGLEAALACGADEVAVFAAATETFSRRNTNCSVAEGVERCRDVAAAARSAGVRVRGYISVVLGCPYEGEVDPAAVVDVARALDGMGCYEVSLGDTLGTGTPGKTRALVEACAAHIAVERLAVHCHDTYGQALANCYAALEAGVAVIDASVAGLGGCPYAKGATGNVATEDVVYMLRGLGSDTGVDLA